MAGGRKVNLVKRGGSTLARNPNQLHETEEAGTQVLLTREGRRMRAVSEKLWEPACGRGRMARVFSGAGFEVTATDLVARGYGQGGVDFPKTRRLRAPVIATNPPYGDLAEAFIRHAAALGALYLALLLKSDFFHATDKANRDTLFRELTPSRVHPLGFRLDWTGQGSPVMNCSWFIWDWSRGLARRHDRDPSLGGPQGEPFARLYAPVRRAS